MLPQKADEETAKLYEEFVESFKSEEDERSAAGAKEFVRGGMVMPGTKPTEGERSWHVQRCGGGKLGQPGGSRYAAAFLTRVGLHAAPSAAPGLSSSKKGGKYVPSFTPSSLHDAPKPKAFDDADEVTWRMVAQVPSAARHDATCWGSLPMQT